MTKPAKTAYDKLFIDGAWVFASGGQEDVISPATEEVVGRAPVGTLVEAEQAIAAARRAFDRGSWPRAQRALRAGRIGKLLELVNARKEEAIALMQLEMGFPRFECELHIDLVGIQLTRLMELALQDPMTSLPLMMKSQPGGGRSLGGAVVTRDPIGVVSAITPYNSGFLIGLLKTAPALAAGNAVILKPSPYTPLQTMLIAEMIEAIDLPPGIFNIVTGGADVGQMLSSDPRIDMVTFTGSDAVGAKVMAQAAPTLKKVHLELGGKSPMIIRHDADMAKAVMLGAFTFFHAGQGCALTTRILVDNRIRPAYVEALAAAAAGMRYGSPYDPSTTMAPLIREVARTRTEGFCRKALEEGARLVAGGHRPAGIDKGYYFAATVFDDVANDSYLGQNEVFGPIAAVIGFDHDAEAIQMANDSSYGLGGAILSADKATAFEMALQMRTGQILINGGPGGFHPDMPFGGYKKSGLGREWGEAGFHEYSEVKSIGFPVG